MRRFPLALVLLLFLIAFAFLGLAQPFPTGIGCVANEECVSNCDALFGPGTSCYCELAEFQCYLVQEEFGEQDEESGSKTLETDSSSDALESAVVPSTGSLASAEPEVSKEDIADLELKIDELNDAIAVLESEVEGLDTTLLAQQQNLAELKEKLNAAQSLAQGQKTLQGEVSTISTGLASLQQNVSAVQEDVTKGQYFTRIVTTIFILILLLAAGFGMRRYVKPGSGSRVAPEIIEYITKHIKLGKKFSHIKQALLKVGWGEHDIKRAYAHTMKRNYQNYQKNKQGSLQESAAESAMRSKGSSSTSALKPLSSKLFSGSSSNSSLNSSRKLKIIGLVAFSILVILVAFFLLSNTVGQAINVKDAYAHDEPFECTYPHIPSGGGCCLDVDNNTICDVDQTYEEEKAQVDAVVCTDHNECSVGKLCINGGCGTVEALYNTECGEVCNFNSIMLTTSDGEDVEIFARGQGSYSAAGAVEWKILKGPNYCQGDPVVVPIEVITKGPQQEINDAGTVKTKIKVLSKKILTLTKDETTPKIEHPLLESVMFDLTLREVNEICFTK